MSSQYLYLFELGAILTFFAILWREKNNKRSFETLVLAFIFGMILESVNSSLSQAYFYSKDFLFAVFGTPVAIGAGWAIVYYAAKKFAGKYRLKWHEEPFLMAFVAVIFDFFLDPVAIRLGFWTWRIPQDQEFLGVPYDNFIGWMAAVWTFALLINLSELNFWKKNISRAIKYATVIVSPVLLSLQITVIVSLSAVFSGRFSFWEIAAFYRNRDFSYAYFPEVQVWKMYFFVFIFLALAAYSKRNMIAQRIALRR